MNPLDSTVNAAAVCEQCLRLHLRDIIFPVRRVYTLEVRQGRQDRGGAPAISHMRFSTLTQGTGTPP